MNIGIPACGVVSVTFKAIPVIPGVSAIRTNVGAIKLGDRSCPFRIAWHREQTSFAIATPFAGSPTSAAWLVRDQNHQARDAFHEQTSDYPFNYFIKIS